MRFYNTLTRQTEEFKPLQPPQVKIYMCGPTVYNFLHVGNFRGPVVFNLLRNWLEEKGYVVTFALNFTDVDDKIIEASKKENIPASEVSEKYIFEYKKDFAALGLRAHEMNPKVTDSMPGIVDFIQTLIEQGKAYVAGNDVYYSVRSFPEYGKLSGRKIDDLLSGARVEVGEHKKDPLDFALWKGAKPGEPAWESPWGGGRPGWHIECSAMACEHLGEQIDIHGGGTDLMFPHHENEIAQSEGALGKRFVGTWIHWNMLNFGGQKMSKSLGNFTTMREFLNHHHPEIYKWMILSVHHRTSADFSPDAVDRAITGLARVYSALAMAESLLPAHGSAEVLPDAGFQKTADEVWTRISEALDHDLATPEAFAAMFEFIHLFNSQVKRGMKPNPAVQGKALVFRQLLLRFGKMLSLFQQSPAAFLHELDDRLLEAKGLQREQVQALVDQRGAARAAKDFKASDEFRDKLTGLGIAVSDTPEGSFWEVAK
ncbi:MAG: cysteine--tRNA ligase [Bdellovibrionaceae bacterium]|nr:cysteine--tRNA ligase [Pseudobdellovibrionaceae bacterium]